MKSGMMRWIKAGVAGTLLVTLLVHEPVWAGASGAAENQASASGLSANTAAANLNSLEKLVLKQNSRSMLFNGQASEAVQPVTLKHNVNYIPLTSIAKLYGFDISYDAKTKESIVRSGDLEYRFKINSAIVKVNGKNVKSAGILYIQEGSLMIPLRTWAQITESSLSVAGSQYTLSWNSAPSATFIVEPEEIYATQTKVTYKDQATAFIGRKIVDERWEGKQEMFDQSGTFVVTRQVKDSSGKWSEPYRVTLQVKEPNLPPVADFSTDQAEYRIGEPITYKDLSTDDENSIVRATWTGKEPAFFQSGEHEVTLEVEDKHGLTDSVTKRITVTDEVLYTENQFYRKFTSVGDKFPIGSAEVLTYESVPYEVVSEKTPLILSNSPELLLGNEGIAYKEVLSGNFYFNTHNKNGSNKNLTLYLVATNSNDSTAMVETRSLGIGGPTTYVSTSGKLAMSRFLDSWSKKQDKQTVYIPSGESRVIMPELSAVPIKPGLTLTSHAEIFANKDITFTVVVLDPEKDPIEALPSLSRLNRDGHHMRGTFENSFRTFKIDELLGVTPQRIVVGDNIQDKFLVGVDSLTGRMEVNKGNFGVMYHMKAYVAPHTLVALNARGGHYAGGFLVNGKVVNVTDTSILHNSNQAAALHRTGDYAEIVDLTFSIASGSNLPINLLFLPLNEQQGSEDKEDGEEQFAIVMVEEERK